MDSDQLIRPTNKTGTETGTDNGTESGPEMGANTATRVEAAFLSMEALRKILQGRLGELKDKPLTELEIAGLATLHKDLGKAVGQVLSEEGKVEDALRIERGGDGIDLHAARAEIGSRLVGIREHLGEGFVSGQPSGE